MPIDVQPTAIPYRHVPSEVAADNARSVDVTINSYSASILLRSVADKRALFNLHVVIQIDRVNCSPVFGKIVFKMGTHYGRVFWSTFDINGTLNSQLVSTNFSVYIRKSDERDNAPLVVLPNYSWSRSLEQ
jgi:hypothetical protein